jgi:hypothetical protein
VHTDGTRVGNFDQGQDTKRGMSGDSEPKDADREGQPTAYTGMNELQCIASQIMYCCFRSTAITLYCILMHLKIYDVVICPIITGNMQVRSMMLCYWVRAST